LRIKSPQIGPDMHQNTRNMHKKKKSAHEEQTKSHFPRKDET